MVMRQIKFFTFRMYYNVLNTSLRYIIKFLVLFMRWYKRKIYV